jgi:hypothetical protein
VSNLALIPLQPADFDTQQNCDWLDGLPMIGSPGFGGSNAGADNVGQGSLAVAGVDVGAAYGAHVVAVTGIAGGQTYLSVTDPEGIVTGRGVAGLPLYAAGLSLTLSAVSGQAALAVGDTFAVAVIPVPVDITGLRFDLDARVSRGAATVAMAASTADATPTIVTGGAAGTVAMRRLRAAMARCPVGDYPYTITATDPGTGLTVPAFYGTIHHVATAAQTVSGT